MTPIATLVIEPTPARTALIYAGFAFLVTAATQVAQLAIAFSLAPVESPSRWLISAGAGLLAAGIGAALPWLKAVLPVPVPVTPVAPVAPPVV
jgi:hypothetical protein